MIDVTQSLGYQVHIAYYGWAQKMYFDGMAAGSTGINLSIEAIRVYNLPSYIQYRAHVAYEGWQDWVSSGQLAGTTGRSLDLQALQFRLTSDAPSDAPQIVGRAHVTNIGWQETKSAMEPGYLGTINLGLGMQAVQLSVGVPNSLLIRKGLAKDDELSKSSESGISTTDIFFKSAECVGTALVTAAECIRSRGLGCAVGGVASINICTEAAKMMGEKLREVERESRANTKEPRGDFNPPQGHYVRVRGNVPWLSQL